MFILEVVGMKHLISVIIATFAFALSAPAFANVFKDYYKSSSVDIGNVVQSKTKPQVYSSQDINADCQRMLEDGYTILGVSNFVWTTADTKHAAKFAKKLGASVVLIHYRFQETVAGGTMIMPMIGGYGGALATPINFHRYEQTAYFFAKTKPGKMPYGIWMNDLTTEQSRDLGTSKGVGVQAVVRGSPAFDADLLAGDIILTFAGRDISTPERWDAVKSSHSGQTVPVEIMRNGKRMTLQITAPSSPLIVVNEKTK